jgi:branched-chain amino acid aminotransferase
MAKFEGIHWASHHMRFGLPEKDYELLDAGSKIYAVSRSVHYALFLAFEGIRFYCRRKGEGGLEAVFLNWRQNLERFRRSMLFNIGAAKTGLVPSAEELEALFLRYFREPALRPFFEEMAALGAQGYFRPFTVDEEESIGVTFPNKPSVRAAVSRYDRYLGEPFSGVVVPNLVRAVAVNGTGWLKLGVNYLMSVKAVEAAQRILPEAASALFLDDNPRGPIEERRVTEWDSSCCLLALRDGTVVKIPESELILPSVTIRGIVAILRDKGVRVEERHVTYGELVRRVKADELIAISSVGTAGILNRCQKLLLTDAADAVVATHVPDQSHPLYAKLAEAREAYWSIYKGAAQPLPGMVLSKYAL